jgi:thiamine kinase-like enzyme
MSESDDVARIAALPCWFGRPRIAPLAGGMTNRNYVVEDDDGRHVVRLGSDMPHHMILRWHELAVARAAHDAGLSPRVEHAEPGLFVMRHIDGRSLTPAEIADPARLPAIAELLRRCHRDVARHLTGPALAFWPFQVIRSYAATLRDGASPWLALLPPLLELADTLEAGLAPAPSGLCHNDLLAANLIDDGRRLWLIDWDYAGFGSPLFDLANLASNNGFDETAQTALLAAYFAAPPDGAMRRDMGAMRVVSALREVLWSMTSELRPAVAFDYAAYTRATLDRLDAELAMFDGSAATSRRSFAILPAFHPDPETPP